jgi:hypothetical protein
MPSWPASKTLFQYAPAQFPQFLRPPRLSSASTCHSRPQRAPRAQPGWRWRVAVVLSGAAVAGRGRPSGAATAGRGRASGGRGGGSRSSLRGAGGGSRSSFAPVSRPRLSAAQQARTRPAYRADLHLQVSALWTTWRVVHRPRIAPSLIGPARHAGRHATHAHRHHHSSDVAAPRRWSIPDRPAGPGLSPRRRPADPVVVSARTDCPARRHEEPGARPLLRAPGSRKEVSHRTAVDASGAAAQRLPERPPPAGTVQRAPGGAGTNAGKAWPTRDVGPASPAGPEAPPWLAPGLRTLACGPGPADPGLRTRACGPGPAAPGLRPRACGPGPADPGPRTRRAKVALRPFVAGGRVEQAGGSESAGSLRRVSERG